MKIKLIIILLLLASPLTSLACDICGCGVGSYYLGILPDFSDKFIGVRYQSKLLTTHLGPNGNRTPLTSDETYQSMEVWGAWNFGNRWRIMAILPYNFNTRKIERGTVAGEKHGLGDVVAILNYKLFESRVTTGNDKFLAHSLWVGGGVKAPTGNYEDGEQIMPNSPNNFQLGSGSTDFMFNAAYDIRLMDLGINLNTSYKLNTENSYEYRYGNKFTGNILGYYKFNVKDKVRIAPNVGLLYETQPQDILYNKYKVYQSGGSLLSSVVGVEMNMGRVSIGANYQIPLSQHLANDRALAGNRLMTHISLNLKGKKNKEEHVFEL
ncbi:transporter [Algoriphagus sp. AGSA1]|uniref:transporter n=1 Tax=Algoriphagus sp. AGSA1 TaxID=2907213 RepID=UPI001F3AC52D|nr:transporter [Algoriphagus sp. AGSA1]MCE7057430.1 transporter [Algoriphagus sp. AGSA1]